METKMSELPIKPYYEKDGITIYHGRAEDVVPTLGRFDLLLTDPPFGHGDRWQGGTWGSADMYKDARQWDQETPETAEIKICVMACENSIVWGGNYFTLPPSRCWLSWEKTSRMATLADFELAWTSFDKPSKAKQEDRNPDGKRVHPTQKPLSLMSWCIKQAPNTVKTILDPYGGSMTTLVAAKLAGLSATAVEQDEKYIEAGIKRLAQGVLF